MFSPSSFSARMDDSSFPLSAPGVQKMVSTENTAKQPSLQLMFVVIGWLDDMIGIGRKKKGHWCN